MEKIKSVLFDLDGTFADTAPDLAYALNTLLEEQGKSPLTFSYIRPHVSHGGAALIKLGFGVTPEHDDYEALRQRFLDIYMDNIARETRLFAGMDTVLSTLESSCIPWGIVTNKPGWLTDPLMQALDLASRSATTISGDTTPHSKPHPAPLLLAAEEISVAPANCLYVGDAERDIEAGRNAGMQTAVALFGYIGDDDQPDQWQADCSIEHALDILDILKQRNT